MGIVEGAPAAVALGIAAEVVRATGAAVAALAARDSGVVLTVLGAGISPAAVARIAMRLVAAAGDTADRTRAAAAIADRPALAPVAAVAASAVAEAAAGVAAAGAGNSRGGIT